MAEEAKEMRVLLERCAKKMLNRQIAGAFDRWAEMWAEAKEMRVLLQRCARKMMHRQLAGAFDTWCA